MSYTKEALAKYLEQNANLDSIDPDDLAGLYLAHFPSPTFGDLETGELVKWAEQADQNHFTYQESREAFAFYAYTELVEDETGDTMEEISSCVNWLRVWADILQRDWYALQINRDLWLFVAKFI